MSKIINAANKYFKQNRPADPSGEHIAFSKTREGVYQLVLPTGGCRFNCSMCNYGHGDPINEKEVLKKLAQIEFPKDMRSIVLDASGSFLDDDEIPENLQKQILKLLGKKLNSDVDIDIETHYTTITKSKLDLILNALPYNPKTIELGLETTNPIIQEVYNKRINLDRFKEVTELIHSYGIKSDINILFGAPLLSKSEQITDTINLNIVLDVSQAPRRLISKGREKLCFSQSIGLF